MRIMGRGRYVVHFNLICVTGLILASAAAAQNGGTDSQTLLQRGFEYHQREDYAHSIPILRRAYQIDRQNYFVNLLLGIDLLRTGRPAEATGYLKHASRIRPKEDFPHEYLGEAQADLRHFDEAAVAYAEAVRVAPDSPQATVGWVDFSLARFASLSNNLRSTREGLAAEYRLQAMAHPLTAPERLQLLRKSAELDEEQPGIWSEIALAELAAGSLEAAETDIGTARAKDPSDLRAWEGQAILAAEKSDWAHAAEQLSAIAERSPGVFAQIITDWPANLLPPAGERIPPGAAATFLQCFQRAEACTPEILARELPARERPSGRSAEQLMREQRWDALAKTAAAAGTTKVAWFRRGVAFAHLHDCEFAIPDLERALGDRSHAVESMFFLSWCYAQEASAVAERVQQTGDDDALVHIMRGDILLRLQANSAGAAAEYEAALRTRQGDASIWDRLAEAQLGAGRVNEARANAQKALQLDPHRLSAKKTLAKIAMQERQYEVALPYLRELAARDPEDTTTQVELGTACAQTGNLQEALRNLQPALQKGYPDQKGSLHYLLGTVYRKLGRSSEANAEFETARQLSDAFQHSSYRDRNEQP